MAPDEGGAAGKSSAARRPAPRPGRIAGLVRDEDGEPVEQASVYLTQAPGPIPDVAGLTASDGSFSFAAPVEGSYTVESRAEGLVPVSATVIVRRGEDVRVEISLRAS